MREKENSAKERERHGHGPIPRVTIVDGKGTDMQVQTENIPVEMRDRHKWVLWQWQGRERPIFTSDGDRASTTNDETWASFDEVVSVLDDYDGLGYVLDGSGIICVDLDHCIENGVVNEYAMGIVKELDSYTEISQSGMGLHIFVIGQKPGPRSKGKGIEIYSDKRYMGITGNRIGVRTHVEERIAPLYHLYLRTFPKGTPTQHETTSHGGTHSDATIIEALRTSQTYKAYWHGWVKTWKGFDWSRSDLHLMKELRKQTGGDEEQMRRLFKQSGLYREPGRVYREGNVKTHDYLDRTIASALNW